MSRLNGNPLHGLAGQPDAARFDALHAERLRLELLGQDLEARLRDKRAALEYTGANAAPHATIRH